jgi:hypothetical protein
VTIASTPNDRSRGIVALIEGFFAFMWFGWGQAEAPSWLSLPLLVGSCLGAIVALVGGVVAVRATGQRTAMAEREIRLRYNVIVGVEFLLIGVGVGVLGHTGSTRWIPVWVCAVVGVHFLPLARVFPGLFLVPLAWALGAGRWAPVAVALSALVLGLAPLTSPSTVTGPGAGLCLVAAAVATLLAASADRHGTVTGSVLPLTNSRIRSRPAGLLDRPTQTAFRRCDGVVRAVQPPPPLRRLRLLAGWGEGVDVVRFGPRR